MVVSDVNIALKPCYYYLSTTKLIFYNGYQLLTGIVKHNDRGKYNVSLELTFTTLTIIISLMAVSVLAIHRNHRCMDTDGRHYKGSIY